LILDLQLRIKPKAGRALFAAGKKQNDLHPVQMASSMRLQDTPHGAEYERQPCSRSVALIQQASSQVRPWSTNSTATTIATTAAETATSFGLSPEKPCEGADVDGNGERGSSSGSGDAGGCVGNWGHCFGGNDMEGNTDATHGAGAGEHESNGTCNTGSGSDDNGINGEGIKDRGEGRSSGNGSGVDSNHSSGDDDDDDDGKSSDGADSPLSPHASNSPPEQARCFNCNVFGGHDERVRRHACRFWFPRDNTYDEHKRC